MFSLLEPTPENQYLEGVWSRFFGQFMQSGREKAGLSVDHAAALASIDPGQWSAMEVGNWLPETRQQFRSIAAALNIEWSLMVSVVQMCSQAWGIK
jgi:hypothetical protein